MADFEVPSYLKHSDVETITERIVSDLHILRPDLDLSEGSFVWDMIRPLALQMARAIEFNLTELAKNIFPQYAYGTMLDYHANERLLFRKNPIYSFGQITFYGEPGAVIERGTIVMTVSTLPADSIQFETLERVTIKDDGQVSAEIRALEPGSSGNVKAGAISAMQVGRSDITEITNLVETSGGADTETDEELYKRIRLYDQRISSSYVGTENDYKLWTLEVPGVGSVRVEGCLDRTGDGGDGIVHVSITDSDGNIANERLKEAVRDHLESPDDPENKLTAVNARLVIETPQVITVDITADVELNNSAEFSLDLELVENQFIELAEEYIKSTFEDGKIYRKKLGALLDGIYGVLDYENLRLNGDNKNISFSVEEIPVLGEVKLRSISE